MSTLTLLLAASSCAAAWSYIARTARARRAHGAHAVLGGHGDGLEPRLRAELATRQVPDELEEGHRSAGQPVAQQLGRTFGLSVMVGVQACARLLHRQFCQYVAMMQQEASALRMCGTASSGSSHAAAHATAAAQQIAGGGAGHCEGGEQRQPESDAPALAEAPRNDIVSGAAPAPRR
jgi:hypothetical protein